VINALARFWPAPAGSIEFDGRPIEDYLIDDLRQQMAIVPQRIHLFNTSIRANLLLARPDASTQELEEACRIAGLTSFIAQQPDGLDTFVGEAGTKLSGGQVRRIGIARAVLKDAPVLVLDEPGEGLDASLEQELLDNLFSFAKDRSLLLITHSLAGLEQMDEVLVLDRGRVVEQGAPDQLMHQRGNYFQLHNLLGEFRFLR
jgi:ATP-binding cassette subfamily C protein CydC